MGAGDEDPGLRGKGSGAKGVVIARSVEGLHSPNNILTKQTALDETVRP